MRENKDKLRIYNKTQNQRLFEPPRHQGHQEHQKDKMLKNPYFVLAFPGALGVLVVKGILL
jgi:hypothetical protein